MKNKFYLINGFIAILLATLLGCKPDKIQKQYNVIDSYAHSLFCTYGYGSYWAYQNQSSYDSMYVTDFDSGYDTTSVNELFFIDMASIVPNYEVDLYLTRLNNSQKTHAFINYNVPYGVIYELTFSNNLIDSNGLLPYSYAETLYNYHVNQYNFPQVLKIYSAPGDSTRYVIFAPNVGIVEKRLDTNTTAFKLTNYKIIN